MHGHSERVLRQWTASFAVLAAVSAILLAAPTAFSGVDDSVGHEDQSFTGARHSPTGSEPESKLWFHDGFWWGSLFDVGSGGFRIFRLDADTQRWIDTGVPADGRASSRADALWDGRKLYIASHVVHQVAQPGLPARLYRFSYDRDGRRFVLDPGFPERINDTSSEALVIDKDSTGRLWATWVEDGQVYVNRTLEGDTRWGEPFVLPAVGVQVGPDVASLVAFDGDKIGVFWGNQKTGLFYFAVHLDGSSDEAWEPSETIADAGYAADHVNLKADSSGRVYAAVKTQGERVRSPLVSLLVRDQATGTWTTHAFGRVADRHSRPIVLVNERLGAVYLVASAPLGLEQEAQIVMKVAPIDGATFDAGEGIPIMRDVETPALTYATSTKQLVSSETGLVVLASNNRTGRYWHSFDPLASSPSLTGGSSPVEPPPVETPPPAAADAESLGFGEVLSRAVPALLVAFGLPLWLLVAAVALASRRLVVSGVSGLVVVACAALVTVGTASILL